VERPEPEARGGEPSGDVALREDVPVERLWLDDGSWVDVARGWLVGADALYEMAVASVPWRQARLFRYERYYDEPRLTAWWSPGSPAAHPVVVDAHRALRARYRVPFEGFGYAWYRDGRDSVAFHRDRDLRWLDDTVIAIVTLGARRPWQLRPRANRYAHELPSRGATHDLAPGSGDLLVMGGRTQVGWEHAVPKVPGLVGGRISLQWRWTARTGRPEIGASFRAPRTFSRDR
jgi:alkylated DNA repair dioxygenase AlkB